MFYKVMKTCTTNERTSDKFTSVVTWTHCTKVTSVRRPLPIYYITSLTDELW